MKDFQTTVIKKYNNSIRSNLMLILIPLILVSVFVIQISYFIDGFKINQIGINDYNAWKAWMTISLSTIGSIFLFFTIFAIFKKNKLFFYISLAIASSTLLVLNVMLFLWIDLIKIVVSTWIIYTIFKTIDNKYNKIKTKNLLMYIGYAIVAFCLLGMIMYLFDSFNVLKDPWPFLDAFNSAFLVLGIFLIKRKNKFGWLFVLMSSITFFTTLVLLNVWPMAIMTAFIGLFSAFNYYIYYLK